MKKLCYNIVVKGTKGVVKPLTYSFDQRIRRLEIIKEEWKDISGYENFYKVSNLGRVISLPYIDKRGFKRTQKFIQLNTDRNGYKRVGLTGNNNKRKYLSVHRLVAQAFIPNPDNKPQVNHKDSDRSNNSVTNLEWVTSSENNTHAYKFGKNYPRFGKENGKSNTIIQYDLNGNFIKEWESLNMCANELYLQESCISMCCSGKRKTTGGFIFKKKGDS